MEGLVGAFGNGGGAPVGAGPDRAGSGGGPGFHGGLGWGTGADGAVIGGALGIILAGGATVL
jgi:hypothetical protein